MYFLYYINVFTFVRVSCNRGIDMFFQYKIFLQISKKHALSKRSYSSIDMTTFFIHHPRKFFD